MTNQNENIYGTKFGGKIYLQPLQGKIWEEKLVKDNLAGKYAEIEGILYETVRISQIRSLAI